MIKIYADGACTRDGEGGWAIVVKVPGGPDLEQSGPISECTNNVAELTAAIKALEFFPDKRPIEIISDSQYVVSGATHWLMDWKLRGWKTAELKPVKNQMHWKIIDSLLKGRKVQWTWVKGHDGNLDNERCDRLAQAASRGIDVNSMFKPTHRSMITEALFRLVRTGGVWIEKGMVPATIFENDRGEVFVTPDDVFAKSYEKLPRGERITKPDAN